MKCWWCHKRIWFWQGKVRIVLLYETVGHAHCECYEEYRSQRCV